MRPLEGDFRAAFPGWEVHRAFTSSMVARALARRGGDRVESVQGACERLARAGFSEVVVQSTHVVAGAEFDKVRAAAEHVRPLFDRVAVGAPLLASEGDCEQVAEAIADASDAVFSDTAVCLAGHGTATDAQASYGRLARALDAREKGRFFVGCIEADPTGGDVAVAVRSAGFSRAVIRPLMLVAGEHVANDLADAANPSSWAVRFARAGIEARCVRTGAGELARVRRILVDHALSAAGRA